MPSMQHFGFGPRRTPVPTPRPGLAPMPKPRPNLGLGLMAGIPPMPPNAPFAETQARSMAKTAEPKSGGFMSALAGSPNLLLALGGQLLAHRNDAREPMFEPAGLMLGTKADRETREKSRGERAYLDIAGSFGLDEKTARAWQDAGMGEHLISSHLAKLEPGWRVATPEEAAQYGATAGQFSPDGQFKPLGQEKQSALDQKIDRLMEGGVEDRETAIGIATGRFVTSRHPVDGSVVVIDKATGMPVGNQASVPGSAPAPGPAPDPTAAPVDPASADVPADDMGDRADFPSAFGAEGVFKNVVNIAGDFLGAGQMWPDAATAKRQIENLNTQTATLLAEGTETRGGKYLLDRFDSIQAQAGGVQGPEDAMKTLREIKGLLEQAYGVNARIAQANVSGTEKSNANAALERLGPIIQEYDQIVGEFERQLGPGSTIHTTPGGVRYEVLD